MSNQQSALQSPWVRGFLLMGAIFLAANVYLIYLANKSAPSLVSENYYERGQDYEKNMLKRMAKDPGWDMRLLPPGQVIQDQPAVFEFTLQDKDGKFVEPDEVKIYAYRPSDAGADFSLLMTKLSAGSYRAELSFPLKGKWDLLASVISGEDEFNVSHQLIVLEP